MAILMIVPIVIHFYLPFFRKLNVASAYEYLEQRFSSPVRFLASLFFCLFMFARVAIVLFLPSLALNAVTGLDVYACILLMGLVTLAYCTMGGIEAVIWGDVIQGIILVGGAIISLVYLITGIDGGLGTFMEVAVDEHKFNILDFSFDWTKPVFWVTLLGGVANQLLTYTSDQSVVQRYITVKDTAGTKKGLWLNGVLSVPIAIIFFSILFGYFVTLVGEKSSATIINFFEAIFEVIMKIVLTIIKVAPIGVFAIVAKMISMQAGDMQKLADIAQSLGLFVLIIWIGCAIHFFIIMPSIVYFLGHENPWRHMKKMSTAILTAFSTCSSGAALPFSMKDSQEKCGISNKIASFTLPLGATINMNGTALYEGVAVIFIAQVYGIDLSFLEQLIIVVTVLFSAIGAASIPMAGLVMLSVALSVAGLPMEGIGLVLAVEQLCDMPRTATNSYGDMCAAVVIAKSEGEKLTI